MQLKLNNSNSKMTTRPGQDINYQLLRLPIDIIPTYHGDTHTLEIFIENCESFGNLAINHKFRYICIKSYYR